VDVVRHVLCHQLHVQTTFHVWKTRGCQRSFRLLMMGGVLPETCWASYKYEIMKFWYIVASCWIFLYDIYYPRTSRRMAALLDKQDRHCTYNVTLLDKQDRHCTYNVTLLDKQDRHCTYNVTLRRPRITIVTVESSQYYIFWVCACSRNCPACNAHAPYCLSMACPAVQYFPTLSHKRHDFRGKRAIERKMCFNFFCILSDFFVHSKKYWAR
jgi:hypothetical protein